jgi:hypothetical protein
MQKQPSKAPRKHLTTACVPCRESKIRVGCLYGDGVFASLLTRPSAMGLLRIAKIARGKEKTAGTRWAMTRGSMSTALLLRRDSLVTDRY